MGRGARSTGVVNLKRSSDPSGASLTSASEPRPPQSTLLLIDTVFHIGNFDLTKKRDYSHEGSGLSVSLDPETWRSLARLGNAPIWKLSNPTGTFVEYHAAKSDKTFTQQVYDWALAQGYVTCGTRYEVHTYDDELNSTYVQTFDTLEAAQAEEAVYEDGEPSAVKEVAGYLLTRKGAARACHSALTHAFVFDFALGFYVEDTMPDIDGIWWADDDAPENYSAPRGAIFPSRLPRWTTTYGSAS